MRVLFSSTPGYGHVLPLLPLARAFATAEHDVGFASGPSWRSRLQDEGFDFLPVGLDDGELKELMAPHRAELLALPVADRRPRQFSLRFAVIEAPARFEELGAAFGSWQPDLVVHESAELVAPLFAARAGVLSVHHGFGRLVPVPCFEAAASLTARLWRAAGLEPQPLGGVFRGSCVDICPPSLAPEASPAGVPVHRMRPVDTPAAIASDAPRQDPLVYVTLGTVVNELGLFRVLLDGLAALSCRIIATVGAENDPAALGPLPSRVRVERFVPQAELLPHCSLVVSHGGSGSMLGALAHGVPLLLVPQAADQFDNAAVCAAAGVGRVLMPAEITPANIQAAADELLRNPSYTQRAGEVGAEIAAMSRPEEIVSVLAAASAAPLLGREPEGQFFHVPGR